MNYVSKKQRGTALLVLFLIIVLTLTFFAVAYTKTIFSALAPANACPHFVNYSHPLFVCPPDVLSLRRVLRGNHTREYERLGGAAAFHSQFWEDWFVYSEFFHDARYRGDAPFFIELGGYDGTSGSNSYFYDRQLGWRGLLLEASTPNYALMESARLSARVATLHGGVCREPRLLTLWGGHSLTANNRKEANGLFHAAHETRAVCLPMAMYLQQVLNGTLGGRPIETVEYFSMDVEGQELEIIESHDWTRHPVFVVSIETAVQPLLSGTAEYQHEKRCALYRRGLCRWPFFDDYVPPAPFDASVRFWDNNEVWVNAALLHARRRE